MKGFLYGLTAGLAAGVIAQMMIARNHEQMIELVNTIKGGKIKSTASINDLIAEKERLDAIIREKSKESNVYSDSQEFDDELV